jgi:hypothetical protein
MKKAIFYPYLFVCLALTSSVDLVAQASSAHWPAIHLDYRQGNYQAASNKLQALRSSPLHQPVAQLIAFQLSTAAYPQKADSIKGKSAGKWNQLSKQTDSLTTKKDWNPFLQTSIYQLPWVLTHG